MAKLTEAQQLDELKSKKDLLVAKHNRKVRHDGAEIRQTKKGRGSGSKTKRISQGKFDSIKPSANVPKLQQITGRVRIGNSGNTKA